MLAAHASWMSCRSGRQWRETGAHCDPSRKRNGCVAAPYHPLSGRLIRSTRIPLSFDARLGSDCQKSARRLRPTTSCGGRRCGPVNRGHRWPYSNARWLSVIAGRPRSRRVNRLAPPDRGIGHRRRTSSLLSSRPMRPEPFSRANDADTRPTSHPVVGLPVPVPCPRQSLSHALPPTPTGH